MHVVSIDPGVHGFGIARFLDGCLLEAARIPFDSYSEIYATHVDVLICEIPRVYPGLRQKGDQNDLIDLAFAAGRVVERFNADKVVTVYPRDWKGSVPKPKRASEPYIIETRVRRELDVDELARFSWPKNAKHRWDVADAIGIGLKHLGRL